jgi:5-keto 4-deoxyuronate isomerase
MQLDIPIQLQNLGNLRAKYFLEPRKMGTINIGNKCPVESDGEKYELDFKRGTLYHVIFYVVRCPGKVAVCNQIINWFISLCLFLKISFSL